MKSPGKNRVLQAVLGVMTGVLIFLSPMPRIDMPLPGGVPPLFAEDENGKPKGADAAEGKDAQDGEEAKGEDGVAPCPECPECPDPAKVVLAGLKEKKEEIAKAMERLNQEKKKLEGFKEELDEKLEKFTQLKNQIDADFARLEKKKSQEEIRRDAEFEAKMNRLVKMYAGMKPKSAGAIVNKMDLEVAREIFSRMRETSAAQILSYVNSETAAKISESIAYKEK